MGDCTGNSCLSSLEDDLPVFPWWLAALGVGVLGILGYWLFDVTEGAYLGSRVVALLYDWSASRYDDIKGFDHEDESWFLAQPLLNRLAAVPQPLILDVATGTARLPRALFRESHFQGRIVALDLSQRMLEQAARETESRARHILFLHQDATALPFPEATFDAVACLEALEFLPHARRTLQEMVRVLRPGGVLLTTNRRGWQARLFWGRALARSQVIALLQETGLEGVTVQSWQVIYDLVWARRSGDLLRGRFPASELSSLVQCPQCHSATLHYEAAALCCPHCGVVYPLRGRIASLSKAT